MARNHKSELLIPGGSYNRIKTAFMYGADVVYAGTPDMSLRVKAKVTLEEMSECIAYAHSIGKKIYLAVNLYTHNKDIAKLPDFASTLKKLSPDGVIIADAGKVKVDSISSLNAVDIANKNKAAIDDIMRETNMEALSQLGAAVGIGYGGYKGAKTIARKTSDNAIVNKYRKEHPNTKLSYNEIVRMQRRERVN